MVFGKHKHNLTKILRFPHKDPYSGADQTVIRTPQILFNAPISFNENSDYTFPVGSSSTLATGPTAYYTTTSSFKDMDFITNAKRQI